MTKGVKKMSNAATVLDTIKKTKGKGGMTSAQIKLAEAQSEDYAEMKQEIKDIKSDMTDLKQEVSDVKIQLAEIKGNIDVLLENSKIKLKLIDNKYFWIALIVLMMLIAGVNHLAELKDVFN